MARTIFASMLLSIVLTAGWMLDAVSYHEPAALQPLRPSAFQTASSPSDIAQDAADRLNMILLR
jgi:hypothetical protein